MSVFLHFVAQGGSTQTNPVTAAEAMQQLESSVRIMLGSFGLMVLAGLALLVICVPMWWRRPQNWHTGLGVLTARPWEPQELRRGLLLVMAGFLVASLIAVGAFKAGIMSEETPERWVPVQAFFLYIPFLLFLVVRLGFDAGRWSGAFGFGWSRVPAGLRYGLLFYVGSLPLIVFYSYLNTRLLQSLNVNMAPQDIALILSRADGWWKQAVLFLTAAVAAPLAEELFFRGIALPVLVRRLGITKGVLVVSALFAMVHGHVPSLVPLFVLAVCLSLAYIYSGTIMAPVVMHAVFNAVNIVMMATLPESLWSGP